MPVFKRKRTPGPKKHRVGNFFDGEYVAANGTRRLEELDREQELSNQAIADKQRRQQKLV